MIYLRESEIRHHFKSDLKLPSLFTEDWEMVQERSGCENRSGQPMGKLTVDKCSQACKNRGSTMFALYRETGTTEYEFSCGRGNQCSCYCVENAHADGTCVMRHLPFTDLYRIPSAIGVFICSPSNRYFIKNSTWWTSLTLKKVSHSGYWKLRFLFRLFFWLENHL